MLDLNGTAEPIEDYLAALRLLEGVAGDVDVLVPGHGSISGADQVHARIDEDRAYVHALRDAHVLSDPRVGPSAKDGWHWVARRARTATPAPRPKKRARRDARLAMGVRHDTEMVQADGQVVRGRTKVTACCKR